MPERRVYRAMEIDSAVNDAAGNKEIPATTVAERSKNQVFGRAPQTPTQQEDLQRLLQKQSLMAEKLRNR